MIDFAHSRKWWPLLPKEGHMAVFGKTGSGKTWSLVALAIQAIKRGMKVIAFIPDPKDAARFKEYCKGTVVIFEDIDRFVKAVEASRNCLCLWDEVTWTFSAKNKLHLKIPTYSRHWGHQMVFAGHRYTSFHTLMRGSCDTIIVFRQDKASARLAGGDAACEELEYEVPRLKKGQCIVCGYDSPTYHRVFTK